MNPARGMGLLVFLVYYSQSCFSQGLNFNSEKITIEVRDNECILTGIYYFINPGKENIRQTLFYPFFTDESLPLPMKYQVTNYKNGETINSAKRGEGIIFPVEVLPGDTAVIEVQYYQKTPQKRMEYILTTTQIWGKPFDKAEYEVILPLRYTLKAMYPDYENITKNSTIAVYKAIKENFMPEKNFAIKWEGVNHEKN